MMHEDNPLAKGEVDEDPIDFHNYGQDADGPSPFDESENNVQVPPIGFRSFRKHNQPAQRSHKSAEVNY